jgi:hypothetical protein
MRLLDVLTGHLIGLINMEMDVIGIHWMIKIVLSLETLGADGKTPNEACCVCGGGFNPNANVTAPESNEEDGGNSNTASTTSGRHRTREGLSKKAKL